MAGESDGIYRSGDGGQTWTQVVTAGAPTAVQRLNIGISADGMTLYAGGKDPDGTTQIWKSVDGGATGPRSTTPPITARCSATTTTK